MIYCIGSPEVLGAVRDGVVFEVGNGFVVAGDFDGIVLGVGVGAGAC